ncbi:MAG: hypothetical protein KJ077_24830 [Anaerolineae bacterium]|nr:hypothetical protein [Anaerolineae bacterium]
MSRIDQEVYNSYVTVGNIGIIRITNFVKEGGILHKALLSPIWFYLMMRQQAQIKNDLYQVVPITYLLMESQAFVIVLPCHSIFIGTVVQATSI